MHHLKTGLAIIIMSAPACAADPGWDTNTPEKNFTYQGAPIHPGCPSDMEPRDGASVSLATCTAEAQTYRPVRYQKGEFSANSIPQGNLPAGYVAYQVLAAHQNQFILRVSWNGGGSGYFEELSLYEIHGDRLIRKNYLAGGDRCNGGVTNVYGKDGQIYYAVSATPFALVQQTTTVKITADTDLPASARSCAAEINMMYDPTTDDKIRLSVHLTGSIYDNGALLQDASDLLRYEHCFNVYYNTWYTAGHRLLKGADITAFGRGFRERCMH